jgi:acyl-CoA synthetase (AMP-forming)/AMP-acid ligase II
VAAKFLLSRFQEQPARTALRWQGTGLSYGELASLVAAHAQQFADAGIRAGDVVVLAADYHAAGIAALLALIESAAVMVPFSQTADPRRAQLASLSAASWLVQTAGDETPRVQALPGGCVPKPIQTLRDWRHPGLILFTSGSTGAPKGIVHDLDLLLEKFETRRRDFSTIAFLLFDHIGGLDTMFYSLSNLSKLVAVPSRSVEDVCRAAESERAEVLPTSPTFLNLLLLAEAHRRFDLSSLRIITYGAEVMPPGLLQKCAEAFPGVEFVQKYGASEIGALRSRSRDRDSVWVKLGGEGVETRVVDGELQIRARSAMVGYLNAPSPFTADGWFKTGDQVQVDGEWLRILGRQSDVINVGGDKVSPAEVESVILQLDGVREVSVRGERSAILGQQVVATVSLSRSEPVNAFRARLVQFCRSRLENFKIPQKIIVVDGPLHDDRFKVVRRAT